MQEAMELEKKKLQRQSQDLEKTVNEMMAKRQQEQDERARLKRVCSRQMDEQRVD